MEMVLLHLLLALASVMEKQDPCPPETRERGHIDALAVAAAVVAPAVAAVLHLMPPE